MKKLLVVFLCLAMIFAFAACTNNAGTPADTDADTLLIQRKVLLSKISKLVLYIFPILRIWAIPTTITVVPKR